MKTSSVTKMSTMVKCIFNIFFLLCLATITINSYKLYDEHTPKNRQIKRSQSHPDSTELLSSITYEKSVENNRPLSNNDRDIESEKLRNSKNSEFDVNNRREKTISSDEFPLSTLPMPSDYDILPTEPSIKKRRYAPQYEPIYSKNDENYHNSQSPMYELRKVEHSSSNEDFQSSIDTLSHCVHFLTALYENVQKYLSKNNDENTGGIVGKLMNIEPPINMYDVSERRYIESSLGKSSIDVSLTKTNNGKVEKVKDCLYRNFVKAPTDILHISRQKSHDNGQIQQYTHSDFRPYENSENSVGNFRENRHRYVYNLPNTVPIYHPSNTHRHAVTTFDESRNALNHHGQPTILRKTYVAPIREVGDTDMNRHLNVRMNCDGMRNPRSAETTSYRNQRRTNVFNGDDDDDDSLNRQTNEEQGSESSHAFADSGRSEISESFGRSQKSEKIDQSEESERLANLEKSENTDEAERFARSAKLEYFDESERTGRSEKSEKFEEADESEESPKFATSEKSEKSEEVEESKDSDESVEFRRSEESENTDEFKRFARYAKLEYFDESESTGRSENSEKSEEADESKESEESPKLARSEMSENSDESERFAGSTSTEYFDVSERTGRSEKSEEADESKRSEGSPKLGRSENSDESERFARSTKTEYFDESERSGHSEKSNKPAVYEGYEESEKFVKSNKSENFDESERFAGSGQLEYFGESESTEKSNESEGFEASGKFARFEKSEKFADPEESVKANRFVSSEKFQSLNESKESATFVRSANLENVEESGKSNSPYRQSSPRSNQSENNHNHKRSAELSLDMAKNVNTKLNDELKRTRRMATPTTDSILRLTRVLNDDDFLNHEKNVEHKEERLSENSDVSARFTRTENSESSEKSEESVRFARSVKSENSDESEESEGFGRSARVQKSDESESSAKTENSQRSDESERIARSEKPEKFDQPKSIETSEMFDESAIFDLSERFDEPIALLTRAFAMFMKRLADADENVNLQTNVDSDVVEVIEKPALSE